MYILLRVHVDGSFTVFDGSVVIRQLSEGGGAVAVEHLVGAVDLDGPVRDGSIFQNRVHTIFFSYFFKILNRGVSTTRPARGSNAASKR